MPEEKIKYFELLKIKIVETMKQSYPGINPDISQWKGQDITDFQEELLIKVNAQISEKWFYNHMRNQSESLPRIDVLNILSKFAGFTNWDDFVFQHTEKMFAANKVKSGNRLFFLIPLIVVGVMIVIYLIFRLFNVREYRFQFFDANTKETITGEKIEVKVLPVHQSPISFISDSNGIIHIRTGESELKMVVSTPYYKTDTITRILKKFDQNQKIGLKADDYALLIHFISENKVDDWKKRRACLDTIIDNDAMIYQVWKGKTEIGAELYNKSEFIDKLTMPAGNLKHIDVLETRFKRDKIYLLRFRIKEK